MLKLGIYMPSNHRPYFRDITENPFKNLIDFETREPDAHKYWPVSGFRD